MNKKIIAFILATSLMLGAAPAVFGDDISDLTALIESLREEIELLKSQLAGQTSTPSTGAVCFYTDLEQGMTNAEVLKLQQTLNLDPATRVAVSGAGAPGSETTYFGSLTLAAVKAFQAKHGIITTGYVGPLTRAQLNALYCTPTPPTTVPDEEETTPPTTLAGTEGTLTVSSAAIYTESTLKWATANQVVYGFKVKARNSDISVRRVYVKLTGTNLLPWRDLSYITLYEGDNAIKGLDVTKANLVENDFGTDYDVYFDGINVVVPKDGEKTFTVKVTTQSTPENRTAFAIALPDRGVRGVDAVGLNQYTGSVAAKNVTYEGSRASASIQLRNNASTPQIGLLMGSKDEVTKDQPIFMFDVKATNNDATLKTAAIKLTQNNNDLITAAYLFDGNTRLANVAPTATTTAQTIQFTDLNVLIAKDATKTFTVKVDIAKITSGLEGKTIDSIETAATSSFSFIDANDNIVSSISGSASGYKQTVYTAAPIFALSSTPKLTADPNTSTKAVAEFVFTVTGSGDTVYVKDDAGQFTVSTSNLAVATAGTPVIYADKTASGGYYVINPGETVKFTVSTGLSSTSTGMIYSTLSNVKWNTSATTTSELNGSSINDFSNWRTNAIQMY
jgi:hypothetical protein